MVYGVHISACIKHDVLNAKWHLSLNYSQNIWQQSVLIVIRHGICGIHSIFHQMQNVRLMIFLIEPLKQLFT